TDGRETLRSTMGNRLLDAGDAIRLQGADAVARFLWFPGFVGINPYIDLWTNTFANNGQPGHIVLSLQAHLDLELAKAIETHFPGRQACLEAACRGDDAAISHPVTRFVKLRG